MPEKEQRGPAHSALTREMILTAFEEISVRLKEKNVLGEISLFGGAVMALAYSARVSTKDVDALFQPAQIVRKLAADLAEEKNWPKDWLNDGVKGFFSNHHEVITGNLPQYPNLRLTMPTPEYLLAMKCMAGRLGKVEGEGSDLADIIFLLENLKIKSAKEALEIVTDYYPPNRIAVKTQYLLEGLFQEGKI